MLKIFYSTICPKGDDVISAVLSKYKNFSTFKLNRTNGFKTPREPPKVAYTALKRFVDRMVRFWEMNYFLVFGPSIHRYVDVKPKTPKSKIEQEFSSTIRHHIKFWTPRIILRRLVPSKVEIKIFPWFPTTLNFGFITLFIIYGYALKFRNLI